MSCDFYLKNQFQMLFQVEASDEATTSSRAGVKVPKLSLVDVKETGAEPDEKEIVKPTRGRRGAPKKVAELDEEVASSPALRGRRGKASAKAEETSEDAAKPAAKSVKKVTEAAEKTQEATPVKPRRGRKAAVTPALLEEEAATKAVPKRPTTKTSPPRFLTPGHS